MLSIQVLNNIAEEGLQLLPKERYQFSDTEPDAILLRSASLHDFDPPPSLKAVARAGAGTNNIPLDKFKSIGVPVFNTPGANANAVKELVLAGMLCTARPLFRAWSKTLSLSGEDIDTQVEALKKDYAGHELYGKTLGLVGLGAIGVKVANIALSLGMNVIAIDPQITIKNAWQLSAAVEQAADFDTLLRKADYLSLHVPYNKNTHGLLNADNCQLMQPHAVVLNFSRGPVVDEKAILKLLDEEKLANYVCDFPSKALLENPKALCLPHLGASTTESESRCAVMAVKTLKNFLEFGTIENSVNFPAVSMPYVEGTRIAISNQNIPNMLSQISKHIANHKLNIIDMVNRSQEDIAYTLLDVAGEVTPATLDEITSIKGVLSCRQVRGESQ